jgi:CRISPR-associated endonuclease Cas2
MTASGDFTSFVGFPGTSVIGPLRRSYVSLIIEHAAGGRNSMDFVVAYDICHPRRLRRVAKALERRAARCQYSVFLFRGERSALEELLDELAKLIRPDHDVIQAWPIGGGSASASALVRGTARPISLASVILTNGRPLFVPGQDSSPSHKDPDQTKESS